MNIEDFVDIKDIDKLKSAGITDKEIEQQVYNTFMNISSKELYTKQNKELTIKDIITAIDKSKIEYYSPEANSKFLCTQEIREYLESQNIYFRDEDVCILPKTVSIRETENDIYNSIYMIPIEQSKPIKYIIEE